LIAGWDNLGPVLYHTDPSGTYTRYSAKAIGSGAEGAQTSLQEGWRKDLTLAEAEVLALSTLKQVMEEKVRLVLSWAWATDPTREHRLA
jgi:20S proteasome subunit alpha 5